ncbi:DUF1707 domain-containing protein [Aeromicrobium sp. UC242_57]|uniref:DUF1707 domain-containing protein n=1 Tax=Aeromicrobium sp. UC242_57 TaxID=3374624 RepID=UPI0037ABEE0D
MASGAEIWSGFSADPREPDAALLRATDADRDHAVTVLRDAYADGRLTRDEFEARSAEVLGTRLVGGLAALLTDLVVATPAPVVRQAANRSSLQVQAVTQYQRDLRDARNGWIFVSGLCVAIWGATSIASGGLLFFWPIFPSLGVGIGYFSMQLNRESRIEAIEDKIAAKRRRRRGLE